MRFYKQGGLKCFSPPVMIITFLIEVVAAVYVVWKYQLSNVTRLSAAILFFLAIFQLAEFNICEGSFGLDGMTWAKVGYASITMLPPLGYHLAMAIAGRSKRTAVAVAYGSAAIFAGYFLFSTSGLTANMCRGNYVMFEMAPLSVPIYTLYYYGWLIVAVRSAFLEAKRIRSAHKAAALRGLAYGYLAFIIPTTAANVLSPATLEGIPSIMCGFAVFLAIMIAAVVLPQYYAVPFYSRAGAQIKNSARRLSGLTIKLPR